MSHTPQTILDSILPVKECSDMTVVTRIRQIISQDMVTIAEQLMKEFPFWYDPVLTPSIGQVFWSENHYIMNVSSEYLLREMLDLVIPLDLTQRLQTFLDVKKCFGMAEWLSPVYLPFTITSLLNLYDFSQNATKKSAFELTRSYLGYQYDFSKNISAKVIFDAGTDTGFSEYSILLKTAQLDWKVTEEIGRAHV